jgi:hypothetical protein
MKMPGSAKILGRSKDEIEKDTFKQYYGFKVEYEEKRIILRVTQCPSTIAHAT